MLDNREIVFLNQLFARLYEDDNYEKAFTTFLENLKDIVAFQKGDVYFYKDDNEHITFEDFIFVDWCEDSLNSYINDYADIDDVLPIVSLKQPVMFRSSDVFIQDERMKTKYYNELLLPAGMKHSIEGNIYNNDDGYVAGIGIHRPEEQGDFTDKELEILKLSRPHLVNVARKYIDNKQDIDAYSATISALYDIDDIGICIFDDNLKIIDYNLQKGDFLREEHIGEMMRSLITICKTLAAKIKKSGVSDIESENKGRSRIIIGDVSYYAEVTYKLTSPASGKYIAMIYNSGDLIDNFIYEVCDRYGLTDRECQILKYAIKGKSNADIGRELFISIPTVKKHLTNIYVKMDITGKHQILSALIK